MTAADPFSPSDPVPDSTPRSRSAPTRDPLPPTAADPALAAPSTSPPNVDNQAATSALTNDMSTLDQSGSAESTPTRLASAEQSRPGDASPADHPIGQPPGARASDADFGAEGPSDQERVAQVSPDRGPTEWTQGPPVGVGPHPLPWPENPCYDIDLLAHGDARNVIDRYRYWTREAIVADLDTRRHPLHVAIENFTHDLNIGTVVRTANAFAVQEVHIVGRRRWNRRGAMVTDRYQHLRHHDDIAGLLRCAADKGLTVVAVDNTPGSVRLESTTLPRDCLLLFGSESEGLSPEARSGAALTVSIAQFGSTRSINAGVAAGIAMHAWIRQHADLGTAW